MDKHEEKYEQMVDKLRIKNLPLDKIILMIPVQCVEYWLRYLKENKMNPGFHIVFENERKKTIKKNIYGNASSSEKKRIILELSTNIDLDFLASKSHSFRHFFELVKKPFIPSS